ncbi:J domain-containing protein [uncultured Sphingomonas sp.]|uniref:J domain-containing protein n=1 Tax=uncultured Sphingomonas sp. TaxID=158754 RepID=UPI0035CB44FC
MAPSPDYYSVLGVPPTADRVAIHSAWKALLRRYHPDVNHGVDVSARAKEINEAYTVLGRQETRAAYDRSRPTQSSRRPNAHRSAQASPRGRRPMQPSRSMRPSDSFSQPLETNQWLMGVFLLLLTAAPLATILVLHYEESRSVYPVRPGAAVRR